MATRGRYSIPSIYYYATPVFVLLDYGWGISIRAAVLDSMPLYKNLYYGFCVLCGVGVLVSRASCPRFEGGTPSTRLSAPLPTVAGFDAPHIANLLLAGEVPRLRSGRLCAQAR